MSSAMFQRLGSLRPSDLLYTGLFIAFMGVTVVGSLTCYTCQTNDPDSLCAENVTLLFNGTECPDSDQFCTVVEEKGFGMNDGYYMLRRSCNKTCAFDGCGVWDYDEKDFVRCRKCCQDDLCNVGSGTDRKRLYHPLLALLAPCTVLLKVTR